ncbi:MAG: hypothetical protein HQM15_05360 [Deltaproteobacteria bacterium]|nr:hypothetical protein [Deltaproteobacteria bacterium]
MSEFLKMAQNVAAAALIQQFLDKDARSSIASARPKISPISFKATVFSLKGQNVYALQDFRSVASENQDLLYAISKSDAAKHLLTQTKVSSREDLAKIVAQSAYNAVKNDASAPSDLKTQFQQDPSYAALVLANVGGIQDLLKKEDLSKLVFSTSTGETEVFKQLAQKAASLFQRGNTLNDVSFFENNLNAAIYVLNKPDLVKKLNAGDSAGNAAALTFKTNVGRSDQVQVFQDTAVSLAKNLVDRSTYTQTFFENNPELTQFVVATDLLNFNTKAPDILRSNLSYQSSNIALGDHFNFDDLVNQTLSKDAAAKIGGNSSLPSNFLKSHLGLAQLIRENPQFSKSLQTEGSKNQLQVIFQRRAASSIDLQEVMTSLQRNFNSKRALSYII